MSIVIGGLAQFLLYAVAAFAAQNAVFGRSLGITRLVHMVEDPGTDSILFCTLLTLVQVLSAPLCWAVNLSIASLPMRTALRPLLLFLCTYLVCQLVSLLARLLHKGPRAQEVVDLLPQAVFNCCVLGTLLISAVQNFNLAQYLGFALGSGVGYFVSVLLVTEGQRKLNRRTVPTAFRGLPIMLVYIGILALAVYGFTGHTLLV